MYKLLIVDDEYDIRRALIDLVDWNAWGYNVVCGFGDAESAMEYINENPVDVILTDIRMKDKSGIDIAKFVKRDCPDTKVVILSGYREFEYAREAIDNNVYRYLLKPTDPKELFRTFQELKAELDAEETKKNMNLIYKEQILHGILYGYCDVMQIRKYIESVNRNFNMQKAWCAILIFAIQDYNRVIERWKYEKDMFRSAVINFINIKLRNENKIICVEIENEKINVLMLCDDYNEYGMLREDTESTIREVCNNFFELFNITIQPDGLYVYENIDAMTQNFFKEHNAFDEFKDVDLKRIFEMKKEIVSELFSDDDDSARLALKNYIDMLTRYGIDISRTFVNDILIQIYEKFVDFGILEAEIDFGKLLVARDAAELYDLSVAYIGSFREKFKKKDIRHQVQMVEKVKKYIYENYNKDISLDDVSDAVFVSTAYLSRIFKKNTGIKFIDFLTNVRMKKAKELLSKSDYKISEISEMLGYKNTNYFVALFRKKFNMTPLEYKKFNS